MKVLPTALRFAKWGAILGFVCGVVYSVGGFFIDLFTIGLNPGTWMAFGALIGMPATFAGFGFVIGAVIAIVANGLGTLADRMGGGE